MIQSLFCISCTSASNSANTDCTNELDSSEKTLLCKIANQMRERHNKSTLSDNKSDYIKYLEYVTSVTIFDPVDPKIANSLITNYELKGRAIELGFKGQMRMDPITNKERDTRRMWIPTDQLYPLLTQLVNYETANKKNTGVDIYLASYPFDSKQDGIMNSGTNVRKNGDTLSGRTTLVFIGTADTTNLLDYDVLRHKEMSGLITTLATSSINSYYNHGTLCPDSCAIR